MDMKLYADEVIKIINNMSDEEFDKLLVESGLERCPLRADGIEVVDVFNICPNEENTTTYKNSKMYKLNDNFNDFTSPDKVA